MLYYKRGDEWVQVASATRHTQQSSAPVGQCPTLYSEDIVVQCINYGRPWRGEPAQNYTATYRLHSIQGPLGSPVMPSPRTGGFPVWRADGPTVDYRYANGSIGNPYSGVSHTGASPFNGDNQALSLLSRQITRLDGQADNCGIGSCITKFYNGNTLILELDSCPKVTDGEGCSDCCRRLLPMLRGITI